MKPVPSCTIFIFVIIGLVNAACKKSIDTPQINYTRLKVLEFKTNLPVPGARVEIYKCKRQGFGGCSELSLFNTLTTDKDGNFQFDSRLNIYVAEASEGKYWRGRSGGDDMSGNPQPVRDILLTPIGYTKIHIHQVKPHPAGLLIAVNTQLDQSMSYGSTMVFSLPTDTTVTMAGFGNNNNVVNWYFLDAPGNVDSTQQRGQIPGYYINRFDTALVEINY